MNRGRFLVTGALGCIGAWTLHELVREGVPVIAFDRSTELRRPAMLLAPDELARVRFVHGDICDPASLGAIIDEHEVTNVIHLAALQVPLCRADPVGGAQVNVGGTVAVFEAIRARRDRMAPLVYAGSVGMFDAADADITSGRLLADATAHPANLYGVYKLANEGTAHVYWTEHQVASFGLRPLTVFGPGRDQGITSTPTKAMAAAVLGLPYRITFGGSTLFQYARDAARLFIRASRASLPGANVANMDGSVASMDQVVGLIEREVPQAVGTIAFEPQPLPFPVDIDTTGLAPLGEVPVTPFEVGVAETIEHFRRLRAEGRLTPANVGIEPA
jgi:nucleoside-diphosphate-sugar epimerase